MKKTILITGATKGIGLATSQRLAKADYRIIGIARNRPTEKFPGELFLCDLADVAATDKILQKIADKYVVQGVINNVGLVLPQFLGEIDLLALQSVFDLNVRTAVQITQAFLAVMKEQRWGRVVNIASRSIFGLKQRTSYSAAKNALIGCTRTWALELAEFGITVNAIAPGAIETPLFRQIRPLGSAAEKEILQDTPMGRIGSPVEIAAAIEFLLSVDAGFITGQTLCIDGGSSL